MKKQGAPRFPRPRHQLSSLPGKTTVEALGQPRRLDATDGEFTDRFEPYGVHIYHVRAR